MDTKVQLTELCTFWAIQTYGVANLSWTSYAHRYANNTENVIYRVFFVFFLPGVIAEQKATF